MKNLREERSRLVSCLKLVKRYVQDQWDEIPVQPLGVIDTEVTSIEASFDSMQATQLGSIGDPDSFKNTALGSGNLQIAVSTSGAKAAIENTAFGPEICN